MDEDMKEARTRWMRATSEKLEDGFGLRVSALEID